MSPERQAQLDAAVRGVLAPQLRDYQKGLIGREDLEEAARRRANAIRANMAGMAAPQTLFCAACKQGVAADKAACISGQAYCPGCAPRFRCIAPPRRAA